MERSIDWEPDLGSRCDSERFPGHPRPRSSLLQLEWLGGRRHQFGRDLDQLLAA